MTPLIRFLAFHAIIGFGITALFVGALFGFDIAGLRTLVLESQIGWTAAGALTFMLCLVFSSIQMTIAAMHQNEKPKSSGSPRIRFEKVHVPQEAMVLQPVRIKSRRTR